MHTRRSYLPCTLALMASAGLIAQDNQYWTLQHGAHAQLMGGAALAGSDDQAAQFYDPAAMHFVKAGGITASTSFIYYQWARTKDLGDHGLDGTDGHSDNAPRLVAGTFALGDRWRVGIGFVSALYSRFELDGATDLRGEAVADRPGQEVLRTITSNSTLSRDDLLGLGASCSIGPNDAIGISLYGSSFVQRFNYARGLGVFTDPSGPTPDSLLATLNVNERGEVDNLGFLLKLGYYHHGQNLQAGVAVTLPRLSTHLWEGSMYRISTGFTSSGQLIDAVHNNEELPTWYRTPLMIDAGVQWSIGETRIALRSCYASRVDPYDRMVLSGSDAVYPPDQENDAPVLRVRSASHALVNAAVGASFRLGDKADLLAGFRTDLDHFDTDALEASMDISGTSSYWDLYHLSGGVDLHSERVKLTAGLVYAFGTATGTPESIWTAADQAGLPAEEARVKTTFQQIGLTFGFSYFVLGPVAAGEGSKTR